MNSNQLLRITYQHLTRLLKCFMMLTNTRGPNPHIAHCTNTNILFYIMEIEHRIMNFKIKYKNNIESSSDVECLNCSFDEVFISRNLLPEWRFQFIWNDKNFGESLYFTYQSFVSIGVLNVKYVICMLCRMPPDFILQLSFPLAFDFLSLRA